MCRSFLGTRRFKHGAPRAVNGPRAQPEKNNAGARRSKDQRPPASLALLADYGRTIILRAALAPPDFNSTQ